MFSKESLYINTIKYDTQLKLDYKELKDDEIIKAENSVFLIDSELLSSDIAHKINSLQSEIPNTYISTLLIHDVCKLIPKTESKNIEECAISHFDDEFDIAILNTTLFETKHFYAKTGIDFIYSAFNILNLHLQQNVCRNELLIFLFNNKAFLLVLNDESSVVFSDTVDLPTFESVKDSHFYDDDIVGQKLFDEIYYLELNNIIHNTLNKFYEEKAETFIEEITILYTLKQLSNEQIEQLGDELILKINYHPINIEEELFQLSKDKHLKKSFIKPRKKVDKNRFNFIYIIVFLLFAFYGVYQLFLNVTKEEVTPQDKQIQKIIDLPNHIENNNKITKRINNIFKAIPYDVVLERMRIDNDNLQLKAILLRDDTFIKSLSPELKKLYKDVEIRLLDNNKKSMIPSIVQAQNSIRLDDNESKEYENKYIIDEFLPISRVTEQLKTIFSKDAIVKFKASQNNEITKFTYLVNIIVRSPKEFFENIEILNNELYSISVVYPISMIKVEDSLEVEFILEFNQPK